jgi:hypothetical protein
VNIGSNPDRASPEFVAVHLMWGQIAMLRDKEFEFKDFHGRVSN